MIIKWLLRLVTWDGLLPVAIWSAPFVAGFLVPKNQHAIESIAIVLPIVAFIVRYRVGKRYILTNQCSDVVRHVQAITLCLGIILMVFIDGLLVISYLLPAAAAVATTTEGAVILVLYATYLALMSIALFPGVKGRKGRGMLNWLTAPVVCNGDVVCEPLLPDELTNADLSAIFFRMHLIMASIEHERREGRFLPTDLLESIDSLDDTVRRQVDSELEDWVDVIAQFGAHYNLRGGQPIDINPRFYPDLKRRFDEVLEREVTISSEQDRELKRRIAAHDADPNTAISREELKRRLSERG